MDERSFVGCVGFRLAQPNLQICPYSWMKEALLGVLGFALLNPTYRSAPTAGISTIRIDLYQLTERTNAKRDWL
jgi:hypothetical protein